MSKERHERMTEALTSTADEGHSSQYAIFVTLSTRQAASFTPLVALIGSMVHVVVLRLRLFLGKYAEEAHCRWRVS